MNTEKVAFHIISWLKDYAEKSKVKGFVVGVSGGIDSALASTLCAKTGFPTLCVEMPIHQAKSQVNRAEEHIKQLKEEFSIEASIGKYLTESFYEYDSININLKAYLVDSFSGDFKLADHDKIEWIKIEDIKKYDFAPADIPINDYLLENGL